MIEQVISFGCSWTYGDELIDPANKEKGLPHWDISNDAYRDAHSFSGLIAKQLDVPYTCLAYPGASLQSMRWMLNWWLENTTDKEKSTTLCLVGLTEESRISWFNPYHQAQIKVESDGMPDREFHRRFMHGAWLKEGIQIKDEPYLEEWQQLFKLYMTLSDSTPTREISYTDTVRAFDGAAARYDIPMLQFNVLAQQRNPKLPTLLDATSLMEILVIRDKPRKRPLFMPGRHPNEEGHELIAEYLTEKMQEKGIV